MPTYTREEWEKEQWPTGRPTPLGTIAERRKTDYSEGLQLTNREDVYNVELGDVICCAEDDSGTSTAVTAIDYAEGIIYTKPDSWPQAFVPGRTLKLAECER